MEPHEYRRMFELEERNWWFRGRLLMTEGFLRKYILPPFAPARPRLLDLGCGTGLFLKRREADTQALGLDYSLDALRFTAARGERRIMRGDAARLPIRDGALDVITAFDLIEHVRDDRAVVREIWRALAPGGFLLASVPAYPLLWSGHDLSLHHFRRYTQRSFAALFTGQPWRRVRLTSCFALILPPAAAKRLAQRALPPQGEPRADTQPAPEWLNRLLIRAHKFEAEWLMRHDLPFGLSILSLWQKPEENQKTE